VTAAALSAEPVVPYRVLGSSTDRDEWLGLRQSGIGASEMPAILGENRWESALHVYARKVGAVPIDADEESEAAHWGHVLEPIVAAEFSRRTGIRHQMHGLLLQSVEHPWALATLDAETADGLPLECKTTTLYLDGEWTEGAPMRHVVQCHQQMLVTGAPMCRIACLIGGQKFVWDLIERDETLMRRIIHAGEEFWGRVQTLAPPPADGSESSFQALDHLYADSRQGAVELDASFLALDDECEKLKAEVKASEKRVQEIKAQFRSAMADAEVGVLPSGVSYTQRTLTRAGYTVADTTYTDFRRKAAPKSKTKKR